MYAVACHAASENYSFQNINRVIPDGSLAGLSDTRSITSSLAIVSKVTVKLNIAGEFNGDLYCYLRHMDATRTNLVVLLNRPGRASTNLFGYPDAGLNMTFDDSAANGDIHWYRNVATPPPGSLLAGTWQPDARKVDPTSISETSPRGAMLAAFAGGSGSGTWSLYLADTDSGATNMLVSWELVLSGNAVAPITWSDPAEIVYGTALSAAQLNASSVVAGTFTYNPPAGIVLNAGPAQTLSVTFTPTDSSAYLPVTTNVLLNVLKKDLLISANSTSKTYGSANPPFTASYSGFVNGDTSATLTTPVALSSAAASASSVGNYPVTATGAVAANYNISYAPGTLTIHPASTTISLASSANPALPGTPVTFTATITIVPSGAGTVDGAVQFKVDGVNAGAPVPVTSGSATMVTSSLSVGTHAITADYLGSANLTPSSASLGAAQIINTPPVAATDTIQRSATNGTKVTITTLLSNDTDSDGDIITFVSYGNTTSAGGNISRSNDWLIYLPPANFTDADSFTYTITDGRGASVIGTVQITAVDPGATSNLNVTDLGNGLFRIHLDGIPHRPYRIQYKDDLGAAAWSDLHSSVTDAAGIITYTDDRASGPSTRFYRSISP